MDYELYNIDRVSIPFSPAWKNIAISLSGGADSALLAYLLCTRITGDTIVHCISHTRMWKTRPWQHWDSLRIFNWLEKKFTNIAFKRHENFIAPELEYGNIGPILQDEYERKVSGDNIQIRAFAEYVCFRNNIDAYYNAVTRNPKTINLAGMKERDIDLSDNNKHLLYMKHMDRWAFHPFRFTDKSWVISQYKKLDIMSLLDITRSCEGEFKGLDYQTYIPNSEVPICGECFWCKEREWAIEQSK